MDEPKIVTGTCRCSSTNIKEELCSTGHRHYFLYKCQDCKRMDNADGFGVPITERREQWMR